MAYFQKPTTTKCILPVDEIGPYRHIIYFQLVFNSICTHIVLIPRYSKVLVNNSTLLQPKRTQRTHLNFANKPMVG